MSEPACPPPPPPNTNTSATGGPLAPASSPLEGKALYRFIQQWIVGITGLPGPMVRQRWSSEPLALPDAGEAWAAFGINSRPSDMFPQITHDGSGDGSDVMQRNEYLNVLVSFYDTGASGMADYYLALLRDGAIIAQNREYLLRAGFDVSFTGEPQPAPVIIKTRWEYRVDLPLTLRRQIDRSYAVQNLKSFGGSIATDGPDPLDIPVETVPPPSSKGE